MIGAMHNRHLIATLLLTAPLAASAQGSLADKRLAITKGTTPGKVLLEAPSPAAALAPAAAASGATHPPPAPTGLFGRLPPASGRPLNDARRLDAPDQGIVVKSTSATARAAR
jgi:hypothetical protein